MQGGSPRIDRRRDPVVRVSKGIRRMLEIRRTRESPRAFFDRLDAEGEGMLSPTTFQRAIKSFRLSAADARVVFEAADVGRDGYIDFEELCVFVGLDYELYGGSVMSSDGDSAVSAEVPRMGARAGAGTTAAAQSQLPCRDNGKGSAFYSDPGGDEDADKYDGDDDDGRAGETKETAASLSMRSLDNPVPRPPVPPALEHGVGPGSPSSTLASTLSTPGRTPRSGRTPPNGGTPGSASSASSASSARRGTLRMRVGGGGARGSMSPAGSRVAKSLKRFLRLRQRQGEDITTLFARYDADGDGRLTPVEIADMTSQFHVDDNEVKQ